MNIGMRPNEQASWLGSRGEAVHGLRHKEKQLCQLSFKFGLRNIIAAVNRLTSGFCSAISLHQRYRPALRINTLNTNACQHLKT